MYKKYTSYKGLWDNCFLHSLINLRIFKTSIKYKTWYKINTKKGILRVEYLFQHMEPKLNHKKIVVLKLSSAKNVFWDVIFVGSPIKA